MASWPQKDGTFQPIVRWSRGFCPCFHIAHLPTPNSMPINVTHTDAHSHGDGHKTHS